MGNCLECLRAKASQNFERISLKELRSSGITRAKNKRDSPFYGKYSDEEAEKSFFFQELKPVQGKIYYYLNDRLVIVSDKQIETFLKTNGAEL